MEPLDRWDEKERRAAKQEKLKRKIGKYMIIGSLIVFAYYLAYIIPEF